MTRPNAGAIARFFEEEAPKDIRDQILAIRDKDQKNTIIDPTYPYDRRMKRSDYEDALIPLQIELLKLQNWAQKTKARVAVIFEGRDAAGKGGSIKRFTEFLNPRAARVVALAKPSDTETTQWYFQRYIKHLPSGGELVFFDRSWYNRGVVEHVFGFCDEGQREKFFRQVGPFELTLKQDGVLLFKIWLNVGQAEQLRRFHDRENDPLKQWKLSDIDVAGLSKWDAYTDAIHETMLRSHSDEVPWTVIRSDDKRRARLAAMRYVLSHVDYDDKDTNAVGVPDANICGGPEVLDA